MYPNRPFLPRTKTAEACERRGALRMQGLFTIGALMITNTILGVPYYTYSVMGLKTLF